MRSEGPCVPGAPAALRPSPGDHIRNSPKLRSDPALGKIFFFFLYLLQKAGLSHLGLCIPVLLSPFFFPLCAFPFIDSFSAFFKTENRHFLFRSYKAQCRKARHLVSRCKRQGGININAHIRTMSLSSVFESLNQERSWSVTSPRPPLRHAERLTGGSVRS